MGLIRPTNFIVPKGTLMMVGRLYTNMISPSGAKLWRRPKLQSEGVVTDIFAGKLVDTLHNDSAAAAYLMSGKYHSWGTTAGAEAATQTGCLAELYEITNSDTNRSGGTQTEGSGGYKMYLTSANFTCVYAHKTASDHGGTVKEWCLYCNVTGALGFDRALLVTPLEPDVSDILTSTYELTVISGT